MKAKYEALVAGTEESARAATDSARPGRRSASRAPDSVAQVPASSDGAISA